MSESTFQIVCSVGITQESYPKIRGNRVVKKRSLVTRLFFYPQKFLANQRELGLRKLSNVVFIRIGGTTAERGTGVRDNKFVM